MTRSRTRFTVLVAMLSALFLAVPAWASSGVTINNAAKSIQFNTPDTAGAPVTTVTDVTMTERASWMTIDMGGGIDFTSGAGNGGQVGEVDMTTRYIHSLCLNRSYNYPITSVSPISSGAPSGTIAELAIDAGFTTIRAYVVRSGGKDSIEVDMPGSAVCSNTTTQMVTTTYAHVDNDPSKPVVARNSSTPGMYTLTVTIIDTSSNSHSDTHNYYVN